MTIFRFGGFGSSWNFRKNVAENDFCKSKSTKMTPGSFQKCSEEVQKF